MIEMECPHCGHLLRILDKYAGTKGGCIHCKGRFVLPDAPPRKSPGLEPTVAGEAPSVADQIIPDSPLPEDLGLMPTSLSSLENMHIDGGTAPLSPAFKQAEEESREKALDSAYAPEGLGCLFWGLAFHLPPVALIWAFTLPKDHESKKRAIGVSAGFLILAVALIALLA